MKITYYSILACLALAILTRATSAAIVTPPGLQPGDKFHLVFVTTGVTPAFSSNPPGFGYDQFVDNEATANGLTTYDNQTVIWQALISHWNIPVTGAIDRFNPLFPVYRLDGAKVANDGSDLYDGFIQNPVNIGPDLTTIDSFVWTGSNADGTPAGNGAYLNNGFANARIGTSNVTFSNWLSAADFPWDSPFHVYAFSSELTAAPEPSLLILGSSASFGALAMSRRQRRS
jgi:hypothetical protein